MSGVVVFRLVLRVLFVLCFAVVLAASFLQAQLYLNNNGDGGVVDPYNNPIINSGGGVLVGVVTVFLWIVLFSQLIMMFRVRVDKVKVKHVLDGAASALASTCLASFIVGFFPEFTGQTATASFGYAHYSTPLLFIISVLLFYLSRKLDTKEELLITS